jgi:hypothetical protein
MMVTMNNTCRFVGSGGETHTSLLSAFVKTSSINFLVCELLWTWHQRGECWSGFNGQLSR